MPPKKKPDAPSKKTEMKKKEKVIEVSHIQKEMAKRAKHNFSKNLLHVCRIRHLV